ncbi:hypothetical protein Tco_0324063 [Tanacetum coccineum]
MVFYQMDTEEVSDRFVAPCFVNGLEAYDGEINLGIEENMISKEYVVKLCLEHEVRRGNKVVKKELIVALRDDIPLLGEEGLSPFVCKMGKSSRNKKRAMKNLNFFYQDIGASSSARDKVELDGKIVKKQEEAVKRIKGEALKEKDDPEAFIFPIRLEGQVNENALADTGSDINTMPTGSMNS